MVSSLNSYLLLFLCLTEYNLLFFFFQAWHTGQLIQRFLSLNETERERQTPTFYVFVTALHLCLQPHLRYKQISESSFLAGTLRKLQLEREKQAGCLCCLADKLKGNNNILWEAGLGLLDNFKRKTAHRKMLCGQRRVLALHWKAADIFIFIWRWRSSPGLAWGALISFEN